MDKCNILISQEDELVTNQTDETSDKPKGSTNSEEKKAFLVDYLHEYVTVSQ